MDSDVLNGKGILLAAAGIILLFIVDLMHERKENFYDLLAAKPVVIRWGCLYLLMLLIQFAMDFSNASSAFMYANF